ncbi:Hint domain-containing protein [Frankia sp. ArI3]|uniref:Hint domain-containing protein n=1 Tax=Frankia sp. ArI3 TaxID=1858 RepID=UPI00351CC7B2
MADGTRKRIEEVKVGDRVLATDPTTGRTEVHTVTAVIVGHGLKHLVDVTVATADGPRTLTATDHHPFWDDAHHGWVDADQLTSADRLRTPHRRRRPCHRHPRPRPDPDRLQPHRRHPPHLLRPRRHHTSPRPQQRRKRLNR